MTDDIEKVLLDLGLTEDQIRGILDENDAEDIEEGEVVEDEGIDNPEDWN